LEQNPEALAAVIRIHYPVRVFRSSKLCNFEQAPNMSALYLLFDVKELCGLWRALVPLMAQPEIP
jgi:hypothetical protein